MFKTFMITTDSAKDCQENYRDIKQSVEDLIKEIERKPDEVTVYMTPETNLTIKFTDEFGDSGQLNIDLEDVLDSLEYLVDYDEDEEVPNNEETVDDDADDDAEDGCNLTVTRGGCTCTNCGSSFSLPNNFSERVKSHYRLNRDGFMEVLTPDHPLSDTDGYYPLHRIILEKHLLGSKQYQYMLQDLPGRPFYLDPEIPVVFIDGDKKNVNINNLALLPPELEDNEIIARCLRLNMICLD